MSEVFYQGVSPADYTFLITETPELHRHVQSVMVFDAASVQTLEGGINFEAIKTEYQHALHKVPRYRQKLLWQTKSRQSPYLKWLSWQQSDESKPPVWIDDEHFNLDYHVRHTALPKPGSDEQLSNLAARIAAQPLDRHRPLWEAWIVEGLANNRYAVIHKIHHCLVDAKSGADIAKAIMSRSPEYKVKKSKVFKPRPAPSQKELRDAALRDQVMAPVKIAESLSSLWKESDSFGSEIASRAKALGGTLAANIRRKRSPSVLNGENSPHRQVAFLDSSLAELKKIHHTFNCSLNDVVLAIATSTYRQVLLAKGEDLDSLSFSIAVPVTTGSKQAGEDVGNPIASWTLELPIHLSDPVEQLSAISKATGELKNSNRPLGVTMITSFIEYTPAFMSLAARNTSEPVNSMVTNIPGPQCSLYQLGAKMQRTYPVVPLLEGMGLGIGVMSYNGIMCWGVTSDIDIVPELAPVTLALQQAIDSLSEAASFTKLAKQKKKKSKVA